MRKIFKDLKQKCICNTLVNLSTLGQIMEKMSVLHFAYEIDAFSQRNEELTSSL